MRRWIALALIVLLGIGGCAAAGAQADVTSTTFRYEDTIEWHATYDVVVVGFGGGGAVTAITAADEGAKVLLLEKAPEGEEGGNTRYAGQHVVDFTSFDEGVTFLKAVRGLFTNWPDEFIENFITDLSGFVEWWNGFGYTEYETRPRADYDMPGADSVIMYYTEIPGNPRFWVGLREQVMNRADAIDVWFEAPGRELIQDPFSKAILGVKAEVDGQMINVRALNGVVLATGGFENNPEMVQDYLQRPYAGTLGSLYNTGDGIKMAQAVGADLWHMNATSGPYPAFLDPETGRAVRFSSLEAFAGKHGMIFVGPDGTRFFEETFAPKHGYKDYHGQYMTIPFPLPCYLIIDGAAVQDKLISTWSDGNAAEIEKGWVKTGETLEALAEAIGVPADNLVKEVELFNEYVANGEDLSQGRPAETLTAMGDGPYYAVEITPANLNTQGGPRRNLACEVLDTFGNAIPRLYSVGELGSMHPSLYQGGSNLAECFVTGRTAGKNAAAAKPELEPTTLTVAVQPEPFVYAQKGADEVAVAAGEYVGEGTGMGGSITVKVVLDGDVIKDVTVVEHHETAGISDAALAQIPGDIVKANSADVDAVAGATMTSTGIKDAVKDALSKANG